MSDLYADTDPVSGSGVPIDFRIFTAGMLTDEQQISPLERPIVRMIGSSTERDLHKDTMRASALQDMTNVPQGLLIWLNHDYSVPDSLFGSLVDAPMILHKSGFSDLHIAVEVELENPAAAKTYRYIQKKRRLGCSIGCSVEDYELVEEDGQQRIHITHVRPVEWSVVGVPANQRSWVENAARGLFENALKGLRPVEDALRLAPIVKGLFPRDYHKLVNGLDASTSVYKSLAHVTARPTPTQRILWEPMSQKFFVANGSDRALWSELRRENADLDALSANLMKNVEPDEHCGAPVITPETIATAAQQVTTSYPITLPQTVTTTPQGTWQYDPTTTTTGTVTYVYPITTNIPNITPQIILTLPTPAASDESAMKKNFKTDDITDTENGEALVRQDLEDKAEGDGGERDAAKSAQQARSHKYHIGVKDGGNVTKPGEWASVPDAEWGDPVNYRYPMPDKTHADNAASRWGDASNRSQYSSGEQAIIGRRIAARQSHFGESGEKEKSVKDIVNVEVQEDGAEVITYSDGEQLLQRSTVLEDGTVEVVSVVLKAADETDTVETDEVETPDLAAEAGDGVETKAKDKKPAADADGDDDGDGADDNDDDGDGKGKKKKKPADGKDAEDSDGAEKPQEDNRFVGPMLTPDDDTPNEGESKKPAKGGKKKPAPKSEKEDYAAPTAEETDPQRVALLNSYNSLGVVLGFEQRSFGDGALTKAIESGDNDQLKSLAMVIDDAADQLLRALGVEDMNDDQFEKSEESDNLKLASGAEISSRNVKKLQMVHDMVADFSRGMHCAAYVKRVSDAPAQMADEEQKGDEGAELEAVVGVQTLAPEIFEQLAEQMGNVAKGLESLSALKTAQADAQSELETVRNEVLLTRKALGEMRAEAQELQDNLQFYGSQPTGRPTQKSGREIPAGRAVDFSGQSDATPPTAESAEPKSTEDALKLTSVEYLPGVGRVRRWPAAASKAFRPSLEPDQMACMTTLQIMSYYNGEETVVPIIG